MKYSILIVIAIALCISASPVYAWPEPKPSKQGYIAWGDAGTQWPEYVSNALTVNLGAPPELNDMAAYRWAQAMPAAKPRLAQLWSIPKEVAIEYGANYIEIGRPEQVWITVDFQH